MKMVAVWPIYWKGIEGFEKVPRKEWEIKRVTNLCYFPLSPSPGWPIQRWPTVFSLLGIWEFDKDTERWKMIVAELLNAASQAEGLSPTCWGPQSHCTSSPPWSMVIQFSLQSGSFPNRFSNITPPTFFFPLKLARVHFCCLQSKQNKNNHLKLMEALKPASSSEKG